MWTWLTVLVALVLAWHDVLPGGWRLRSYITPDAERGALADRVHALERLVEFEAENASLPPGAVVFIGSSTIERFPLATCFPSKPCVNRGIASQSAVELAQHVVETLPDRPGGIVLYSGSIDFHERGAEPRDVESALAATVHSIRARFPNVAIAWIGVMPRREMSQPELERLRTLRDLLRARAQREGLAYVDTLRPPFTSSRGDLAEEVSTDRYHLNARGYTQLAQWILEDGGAVGQILAP